MTLLAGMLLAACNGLAQQSSVQEGLEVGRVVQQPLGFDPPPPRTGADEVEIIRGFLRAGTASDGNYDVARRYLTKESAAGWVPDESAVVISSDRAIDITPIGEDIYRLTASKTAAVETDGRYLPAATGSTVYADIRMRVVNGQWRIGTLPKAFGRWLGSQDLDRLYAPHRVTYLSAATGEPLPDVRWFPQDHLPTRLAKALLEPVPAYLTGAVRTAIPTDATLESVPTRSGEATVDLSGTFPADTAVRRAVWTQFVLTLAALPDVNQVMVQTRGAVLDYTGKPLGPLTPSDVVVATPGGAPVSPVLRAGSSVSAVDPRDLLDGDVDAKSGNTGQRSTYPDIPQDWSWLALSLKGAEIAAVDSTRSGISRWRSRTQYEVPVSATAIGRPAYDTRGYLWFGGVGSVGGVAVQLWVVDSSANAADARASAAKPVTSTWLAGRVVVAVELSADGQRAAVVSTDLAGAQPRLDISGVTRGGKGLPTALAEPLRLAPGLTVASDVVWLDDTSVAVLGRTTADGPLRPVAVGVGGRPAELSAVPGATAITSLGSQRDLVVTSRNGTIVRRAGGQWVALAKGTDFAVAPG